MSTEGERLATVEQIARDLRDDIGAWTREQERTRKRLHELETTVRGLVLADEIRAKDTAKRQRKLELRIEVLTLAVGVAAVAGPLSLYLATH